MDYDLFFYLYCFRLNRPEKEFYCSSLPKVMKMLDIANDEATIQVAEINDQPYTSQYFNAEKNESIKTITSMKEVEGFA